MKTEIKKINNDLNIVIEAINNNDINDAIQMLKDIQEDLEILLLMS